ncbi:hypothetical protein [Streptomyces sp. ADI95-17]|uniref:hypothetical protein n=2 Tax=Streptomyces TaxID=1883 RepID=UPI000F5B9942|nr:hypothetical protein [Streptomyces sp. ADI95-17]RPK56356.1 hypothetical protein EES42_41060 [Streptomyces sp. ADI95-17]
MMGSAEEIKPHLIMYVGGVPVGRLYVSIPDMFWNKCRFEPLDAWESVRPLFEQHEEAAKQGFPIDKIAATKEILDRGVELHPSPPEAGPPFKPFMVYVDGETAKYRH